MGQGSLRAQSKETYQRRWRRITLGATAATAPTATKIQKNDIDEDEPAFGCSGANGSS